VNTSSLAELVRGILRKTEIDGCGPERISLDARITCPSHFQNTTRPMAIGRRDDQHTCPATPGNIVQGRDRSPTVSTGQTHHAETPTASGLPEVLEMALVAGVRFVQTRDRNFSTHSGRTNRDPSLHQAHYAPRVEP
jgi:hypothetical protein